MPLIAHSQLPAFAALRRDGARVIAPDAGGRLPQLHIGLLNLMPDAALEATERQFIRLVAAYGDRADLYVHPIAVAAEQRDEPARSHVAKYYQDFPAVARRGLDALIVTGANPKSPDLSTEVFWQPLTEVLEWAQANTGSIMCSCLATHAVLEWDRKIERVLLPEKRWGVYSHKRLAPRHPLLDGLDGKLLMPHSHYFDVSRAAIEAAGVEVLLYSDQAGVLLAASDETPGWVMFQGHPEYDAVSLLKEYKREVGRFVAGERGHPPFPEHYFPAEAEAIATGYRRRLEEALASGAEPPPFPEDELTPLVADTWSQAGRRIFRNWLAGVQAGMSDRPGLNQPGPLSAT